MKELFKKVKQAKVLLSYENMYSYVELNHAEKMLKKHFVISLFAMFSK